MLNLVTAEARKDGSYNGSIITYRNDYLELYLAKTKLYFDNVDNSNMITDLETSITELNNQILELIKQKKLKEMELNFIKKAEQVKEKNKAMTDYIEKLKAENKLNKWYVVPVNDNCIDEIIENGSFKLTIRQWIKKANYNTDNKNFSVNYWLRINDKLDNESAGLIQTMDKTFYNDEQAFNKYVQGRKKYFSKYFQEEKPPVPYQFRHCIFVNKIQLDGYTFLEE